MWSIVLTVKSRSLIFCKLCQHNSIITVKHLCTEWKCLFDSVFSPKFSKKHAVPDPLEIDVLSWSGRSSLSSGRNEGVWYTDMTKSFTHKIAAVSPKNSVSAFREQKTANCEKMHGGHSDGEDDVEVHVSYESDEETVAKPNVVDDVWVIITLCWTSRLSIAHTVHCILEILKCSQDLLFVRRCQCLLLSLAYFHTIR